LCALLISGDLDFADNPEKERVIEVI
jgi:hypothetical protein